MFGAGKSFLLASIAHFAIRIAPLVEAAGGRVKVLVASSTNVAVDRVLLSLRDLGVREFARVGSLRKIAKPLLPFVANGRQGEDIKELQEMLHSKGLSPEDEGYVRGTLERMRKQHAASVIERAHVVGVTCSASTFPVLDGIVFPIVLLDECSQMVEPQSLVPMARFRCARVLLVGDPLQLPPTLPGDVGAPNGLERTLFERLRDAGQPAWLLGTQYRCHPSVMGLCNTLFYGGRVRAGVDGDARAALVDDLLPVTVANVADGAEAYGTGSFYNEAEAHVVADAVQQLVALGLPASAMGVIALCTGARRGEVARDATAADSRTRMPMASGRVQAQNRQKSGRAHPAASCGAVAVGGGGAGLDGGRLSRRRARGDAAHERPHAAGGP